MRGDVSFRVINRLPFEQVAGTLPLEGRTRAPEHEEFIHAQSSARDGDIEPLKSFINDKLGEGWADELGVIQDWSFLDSRRENYEPGEPWSEERSRYLFADQQEKGGEHFWYVCRAFGDAGKSRLVAYGRCNSREELLATAKSLNVPSAHCAVDTGQGKSAGSLYRFCATTGWNAFKGDQGEGYPATDVVSGRSFMRIWKMAWVDPAHGTQLQGRGRKIKLFRFVTTPAMDMLADHQTGGVGHWTVPMKIGRDYLDQNASWKREELQDSRGRYWFQWHQVKKDDHLRDCEIGCLVMALIDKKIIGRERKLSSGTPAPVSS